MSAPVQAATQTAAATQVLTPAKTGVLQRKCACGSPPGLTGLCGGCQEKRLLPQRYSLDRASPASILSLRGEPAGSATPSPGAGLGSNLAHNFGQVQVHATTQNHPADSPAERSPEQPREDEGTSISAPPAARTEPEAQAGPGVLIADDQAREVGSEQMRKTEFLNELERAVTAAADAELAAVGRTAKECPYIATWIGYYRGRASSHVERALRHYAPEAAGARTARDYIPVVAQRVRRAAAVWAATGEITGVPEELAGSLSGTSLRGAEAMVSAADSTMSRLAGRAAGIFTKAKDGGARRPDDPEQIQAELQNGRPLETAVRSRMESAFGHDFSKVRVHNDSRAAEASNRINARAFTIGSDVAFGAGEYQPGTIVGDALLAHELAHVVQQRSGLSAASSQAVDGSYQPLEEDADRSAIGVLGLLWGGNRMTARAAPKLSSGLRLQRCGRSPTPAPSRERTEPAPERPVQPQGPTVRFEGSLSPGHSLQFPGGDQSLGLKDLRDRWGWQVEIGGTVADAASDWSLKQSLVGRRKLVLHNPAGRVHRQTADINTPDDSPGPDFKQTLGHRYFWIDRPGHMKAIDEWTIDSLTQVQNITSWVEKGSEKREVKWHVKTVVNDGGQLDRTNTKAANDHIPLDV